MLTRTLTAILFSLVLVAITATPAVAAESPALVADYWDEFYDHWKGVFKQQNGVVMAAIFFGVVCLFIVMRSGKWKK